MIVYVLWDLVERVNRLFEIEVLTAFLSDTCKHTIEINLKSHFEFWKEQWCHIDYNSLLLEIR